NDKQVPGDMFRRNLHALAGLARMRAHLRRRTQSLASFVAVARPRPAKNPAANTMASLSAWELDSHGPRDQRFAGQAPSVIVREYPSGTGCYCSIGHAAGTLKASGQDAFKKENDHAYERPSAEYPDGTRPSFRTAVAGGVPGDRHAHG